MPSPSNTRPPEALDKPSAHLTVRPETEGPREVRFMFENQEKRSWGAGTASVLAHAAFIGILFLISQLVPDKVYEAVLPERLPIDLVWLPQPGPGGGGGGGNKAPDPPKKAEIPKEKPVVVPPKPPEPTPEPPKEEPPPILNVPVTTLATTAAPGALDSVSNADSRGSGTGTGAGPGTGSGIGPGSGGGTGGGVYQVGNGVLPPVVINEVKPQYTAEAMRAKVQGRVVVECIVLPDGSVGNVEIVQSLDRTFGLDAEAVKAAKKWRFRPGTRLGEPVSVLVTIQLDFTLR